VLNLKRALAASPEQETSEWSYPDNIQTLLDEAEQENREDFYEEDEPIEDIKRAFEEGEHGVTRAPNKTLYMPYLRIGGDDPEQENRENP
jgi:hypothetical protein